MNIKYLGDITLKIHTNHALVIQDSKYTPYNKTIPGMFEFTFSRDCHLINSVVAVQLICNYLRGSLVEMLIQTFYECNNSLAESEITA